MSDISSFSIQNPKQIVSHLSMLIKNKCLIGARFGESNESYITTLLAIDEKANVLYLDYGPKEDLNQRILRTSKIHFDTTFSGIDVSFVGSNLKTATRKGETVFSMPIPRSLFWMQRREYFRVKVPLTNPSYCQIKVEGRNPVNLKLYDISLSGIAMLNVSKEISELLIPGETMSECKLILTGAGECLVSFEICAKYIINPDKLQKIQKIGCKFTKLTRSTEEIVQRYMQQIQRDDLQKEL
jgi:c-di-GMP-binding flagellar brake protein YcgR